MQRKPESEDDEHEMDDPETHHSLLLTPTFELEVVMKRCHTENALANEIFGYYLDDNGECFNIEHESEEEEGDCLADSHGIHCEECTDPERADISHHESSGLDIEIRIGNECSGGSGVEDGDLSEAVYPREDSECAECGDEHASCETIHTISDVDGVCSEHDDEYDERNDHP